MARGSSVGHPPGARTASLGIGVWIGVDLGVQGLSVTQDESEAGTIQNLDCGQPHLACRLALVCVGDVRSHTHAWDAGKRVSPILLYQPLQRVGETAVRFHLLGLHKHWCDGRRNSFCGVDLWGWHFMGGRRISKRTEVKVSPFTRLLFESGVPTAYGSPRAGAGAGPGRHSLTRPLDSLATVATGSVRRCLGRSVMILRFVLGVRSCWAEPLNQLQSAGV